MLDLIVMTRRHVLDLIVIGLIARASRPDLEPDAQTIKDEKLTFRQVQANGGGGQR